MARSEIEGDDRGICFFVLLDNSIDNFDSRQLRIARRLLVESVYPVDLDPLGIVRHVLDCKAKVSKAVLGKSKAVHSV